MDSPLDVKTLIRSFEEMLHAVDRSGREATSGVGPHYPMLVAYLGREAAGAYVPMQEALCQLWPQYREELRYAAVETGAEGLSYARMEGGHPEGTPVSRDGFAQMVSELFDAYTHFNSFSRLLIYYILDTSAFQSADDLDAWLAAIRQAALDTRHNPQEILQMLILLLDESDAHQETGRSVRLKFRNLAGSQDPMRVLLLSSHRSDGRILGRWDQCYRIATAMIAVSNSADTETTVNLFRPGVAAASYAQVEKPYQAISQMCATSLLSTLERLVPRQMQVPDSQEALRKRLGITEQGTLGIMDRLIEEKLRQGGYIPTPEQLDCFPLAAPDIKLHQAIYFEDSPARFNELTFGAWNCYVRRQADRFLREMSRGASGFPTAEALYTSFLRRAFTPWELDALAKNTDRIQELIRPSASPPVVASGLPEDVWQQVRYRVARDSSVSEGFCKTIRHLGVEAERYQLCLNRLFQSRAELHQIREDERNFANYYQKPLYNYLEANMDNGFRIRERFLHVMGQRELEAFFHGLMEDMFKSRTLSQALAFTFEDVGTAEIDQTMRKLTRNLPVYLVVATDMGPPVHSFVLLKTDSDANVSLYQFLKENLPARTHFFNTGYGSMAEALNIYAIRDDQL